MPGTPAEIAAELVRQVGLFNALAESQTGGSDFGRRLLARGRGLFEQCEQYNLLLRSPNLTPDQVRNAVVNLERALQALEGEFQRVPGYLPQCAEVLQRVGRLVQAARQIPLPPPNPGPLPPYNPN